MLTNRAPTETTSGPPAKVLEVGSSAWTKFVPWFMTGLSVLVLFCIAWFLLENILWFRTTATTNGAPTDEAYRIYIYHLHLSMIKRSVGLFAGFSLIFVGTSVAFYTLKQDTALGGGTGAFSAKLNTASPGIVAMVLGVALIMFTIHSKDSFPPAPEGQAPQVNIPTKAPQ